MAKFLSRLVFDLDETLIIKTGEGGRFALSPLGEMITLLHKAGLFNKLRIFSAGVNIERVRALFPDTLEVVNVEPLPVADENIIRMADEAMEGARKEAEAAGWPAVGTFAWFGKGGLSDGEILVDDTAAVQRLYGINAVEPWKILGELKALL
ncbi:MAG: hypothetical protein D6698_13545 [Gammaproteobacteria bacterium]|nr:MAG: hypothetical protein D6698_13545 [Gammaproteobacteria bacterium]